MHNAVLLSRTTMGNGVGYYIWWYVPSIKYRPSSPFGLPVKNLGQRTFCADRRQHPPSVGLTNPQRRLSKHVRRVDDEAPASMAVSECLVTGRLRGCLGQPSRGLPDALDADPRHADRRLKTRTTANSCGTSPTRAALEWRQLYNRS